MHLANPTRFMNWSGPALPWLFALACGLMAWGIYGALVASPADYQQGESVRIMYIHVPAAWMSVFAYGGMAVSSALYLVWKHPLADMAARAGALPGAAFTLITLVTGAIWGKPTWGVWWVWDARLTSVLILFFLYAGYLALENAAGQGERGSRALAVLALIGAANLPIIKFSVEWWSTLHQPASILRAGGPSIDPSMLSPLLAMIGGFTFLYLGLLLLRTRTLLLERKIWRLQSRYS